MEIKDKILEIARQMFMQYGIKSVTMDDLARKLAISKKTIYQYYKDKNAIVKQITLAFLENEKQALDEITGSSGSTLEEMYKVSQHFKQRVLGLNPSLMFDLERYHPEAWMLFRKYRDEVFTKHMKSILERGISEGYFRSDLNPDILTVLRMQEIEMSFNPDLFPSDRFDYKEVQLHLTRHFISGIITEKGKTLFESYHDNPSIS